MNRRDFLATSIAAFVAGLFGYAVGDVVNLVVSKETESVKIYGTAYLEMDAETGGARFIHEYSATKLSPDVFHGLGTFQELRDPAPKPAATCGWLYSAFAVKRDGGEYQVRQVWSLVKKL